MCGYWFAICLNLIIRTFLEKRIQILTHRWSLSMSMRPIRSVSFPAWSPMCDHNLIWCVVKCNTKMPASIYQKRNISEYAKVWDIWGVCVCTKTPTGLGTLGSFWEYGLSSVCVVESFILLLDLGFHIVVLNLLSVFLIILNFVTQKLASNKSQIS